jgi:hypothetical protein
MIVEKEIVDRGNVSSCLGELLTSVRKGNQDHLIREYVSPAGIALQISTNARQLGDAYSGRLSDLAGSRLEGYHIYSIVAERSGHRVPRWSDLALDPRSFHESLSEQGYVAAYPYRSNCWQVMDLASRIGLQLVHSIGDLPPWDFGAPLRQHLHWILKARGMRLVHAATLSVSGRGVLFIGNAGSGKSGTTLAGISVGMNTVGDDYVALSKADQVEAHCLFTLIKQDRQGLARVPAIERQCAHLPDNWKGKVEISPTELPLGSFAAKMEIGAVLLPIVASVECPEIERCGGGEALRALMRSNLHQFPGEKEDGMSFFADILRRLPIYRLRLSTDYRRNGDLLQKFIATI